MSEKVPQKKVTACLFLTVRENGSPMVGSIRNKDIPLSICSLGFELDFTVTFSKLKLEVNKLMFAKSIVKYLRARATYYHNCTPVVMTWINDKSLLNEIIMDPTSKRCLQTLSTSWY